MPLLTLALVLATLPLLQIADNRLVPGKPLNARAALGSWLWPIVALSAVGCVHLTTEAKRPTAVNLLAMALFFTVIGLGSTATSLAPSLPKAGRVQLGSGAFALCALLVLTIAFALRHAPRWMGWFLVIAFGVALYIVGSRGTFDALSITVEYRGRREALHGAFVEHVVLSSFALALAVVTVGLTYPWRWTRLAFEQIAAGLQVVPAVALLGALVAALSALLTSAPSLRDFGIAALGTVPALIGIAGYLLLPLWRGLRAGLSAAEPDSIAAGEALGMTRRQILSRIRLPQGAAVLVGAVRVAAVQSIGLATLGALVGAGGLGRIVFDGMAQYAPDLILLGALPIALLAWMADSALSVLEARLRYS